MEPSVVYVSELYRIPFPLFDRPDPARLCSCGAPVERCPFWAEIRARFDGEPGMLDALRRGQRRYERWRTLPRTLWRLRRRDPELIAHIERMGRFLRIPAQASGAHVVVESSYNPLGGLLYRDSASGIEVRYLHLVRDGRNFLGSEQRSTDRPEVAWRGIRAAPVIVARWVVYHLLTMMLLPRTRRYLRIRYEDLLREPGRVLPAVFDLVHVDAPEVVHRAANGSPIRMRHIAAGNRVRLLGEIQLRPELARPPSLSLLARAVFWTVGGGLELWMGYRPGPFRAREFLPSQAAA